MTTFPGIAGDIEDLIGAELTATLLRHWGGLQISIPVKARGSKLAELIGEQAADDIVRHIGPGKITLPCGSMRGHKFRMAKTREEAKRALQAGWSLQQVALQFDLHTRTVSKYRAELEAEAGAAQMQLPFDSP